MDVASLIGIVMAILVVVGTMGGHLKMFMSLHAVIVVIGGLVASTFLKFNMKDVANTGGIVSKIFIAPHEEPREVIAQIVDMANIARKDGILALEKVKVTNHFLQTAINHCVDGMDPEMLKDILEKEISYMAARHKVGIIMFESMGEAAPAMGMVGTLIGMVEMLSNMSDPSSIGPAMATALLATMYGAIVANMFTIPMGIKLHHYSSEEQMIQQIILDGANGIQKGVSPRILEKMLMSALSAKNRLETA